MDEVVPDPFNTVEPVTVKLFLTVSGSVVISPSSKELNVIILSTVSAPLAVALVNVTPFELKT